MKNKLFSAATFSFAAFMAIAGTTTSASASPYWDCVSETWDPFACAINPDNDSWAIGYVREDRLELDDGTLRRIEAMNEKGAFRPFKELGLHAIKAGLAQTCPVEKLLDIVEETGDPDLVFKVCYKPAK